LQEMIAGTLPNSAESILRLRLRTDESGLVHVEWDSVFGRPYELLKRVGALDQPVQVIRTSAERGDPVILQELQPLDEAAALYGVRVSQRSLPGSARSWIA
jgi:hypothetical protein